MTFMRLFLSHKGVRWHSLLADLSEQRIGAQQRGEAAQQAHVDRQRRVQQPSLGVGRRCANSVIRRPAPTMHCDQLQLRWTCFAEREHITAFVKPPSRTWANRSS